MPGGNNHTRKAQGLRGASLRQGLIINVMSSRLSGGWLSVISSGSF
jgi:hypothetical protein